MGEDLVKIVVEAWPWFVGAVDSVRIAVWAIPGTGIVVPGIAGALALFLYIFAADHLVNEEENW